ncbi:MAG: hypothetical protein IJ744_05100 [Lachnospiraceae bacterium]|nr:hypothetical protein [Lachnospiraceae bacterium]
MKKFFGFLLRVFVWAFIVMFVVQMFQCGGDNDQKTETTTRMTTTKNVTVTETTTKETTMKETATQETTLAETTTQAIAEAESLDYEGAYKDIYYLKSRNIGPSKKLVGKICLVLFFVDTPSSAWSESEIETFIADTWNCVNVIEGEASRYGANLDLMLAHANIQCKYDLDRDLKWYWDIMEAYQFSTMEDMHVKYEPLYGVDDIAPLFIFNEEGRSYTYMIRQGDRWREEFSVFYGKSVSKENNVMHELFHQFGAPDLYFPEVTDEAARARFPGSIMITAQPYVDDFTAFMIGWMDAPDEQALALMEELKDVTKDMVENANPLKE